MTALLERPAWDPVPESLDGIIRRNRDLVRLRLPTEAEVAGVRGAVKRGRPLLTLSPWWLAAIDMAHHEGARHVRLMLVGGTKQGEGWCRRRSVRLMMRPASFAPRIGSIASWGRAR